MDTKNQLYIGAVTKFDENQKTVTANILHFDVANENDWMPKAGCLDAFFAKINKAKKFVPAFYNHNNFSGEAIGLWKNLEVVGNVLVGTLYLTDTRSFATWLSRNSRMVPYRERRQLSAQFRTRTTEIITSGKLSKVS